MKLDTNPDWKILLIYYTSMPAYACKQFKFFDVSPYIYKDELGTGLCRERKEAFGEVDLD